LDNLIRERILADCPRNFTGAGKVLKVEFKALFASLNCIPSQIENFLLSGGELNDLNLFSCNGFRAFLPINKTSKDICSFGGFPCTQILF